jgi:putative oxidoreductase
MLGSDNKTTALVFIRLVLCVMMFVHGAARIANGTVDDLGGTLSSHGIPLGLILAWLITLFELVGSVLLAAGFYAWILALVFAARIALWVVLVHWKEGWFGMEFSVLLTASFLAIAYAGYKRSGK